MSFCFGVIKYTYNRRQAGGIDPEEDVAGLLSGLSLSTFESYDIVHAAYVFDYLAASTGDSRVKSFAVKLAAEYAHRFAEWLGYVFLDRANMTRQTKAMKDVEASLSAWVENIPVMLKGPAKKLSDTISAEALKFFNQEKLDAIGDKILKVVHQEWSKGSSKQANLGELPISYNPKGKRYEIPKSQMTYKNRNVLKDLGFHFDGLVWFTYVLDTKALSVLPQAAHLHRQPSKPAPVMKEPKAWFFEDWLPHNIDRFSNIFNGYGRAQGVPYDFKFVVNGTEVTVEFRRDIKTVEAAIAELEARYGGSGDREGWLEAVASYRDLASATGGGAISAVDHANNLEHSHGSMMEHFPPGIREWYPRFLDFKYTAHSWQMVRAIRDDDLRTIATELMPLHDRMQRIVTPKIDHRTPKGLALEVSSQPGKANKKKQLLVVKERYPDMYPDVVKLLEERNLFLE